MIDARHLYDEDQREIIGNIIHKRRQEEFYRNHRNMWDWGKSKAEDWQPMPDTTKYTKKNIIKNLLKSLLV